MPHCEETRTEAGDVIAYRAVRDADGAHVDIVGDGPERPLPQCQEIANHSPDGFEWGYYGSGPAQLALALCFDALGGDQQRALRVYQTFKERHIATRSRESIWVVGRSLVRRWVEEIESGM